MRTGVRLLAASICLLTAGTLLMESAMGMPWWYALVGLAVGGAGVWWLPRNVKEHCDGCGASIHLTSKSCLFCGHRQ